MKGCIPIKIEYVQRNEITFGGTYLKNYKLWLAIKVEKGTMIICKL